MTLRNIHHKFFSCIEPRIQTRKSCFSVYGQQVKISMKSCQNISFSTFLQIHSCWGQLKRSIQNCFYQELRLKIQSNSQHLSNCKTAIFHIDSPIIHYCHPLGKVGGNNIHFLIDFPMKSPFWISIGPKRCQRFERFLQLQFFFLISHEFLLILVHEPYLIVGLRRHIYMFVSLVVLNAPLRKITLHQIQEIIVLNRIYSWVFDDNQAVLSKDRSYLLTIIFPIPSFGYEISSINAWDFNLLREFLGQNIYQFHLQKKIYLKLRMNAKAVMRVFKIERFC